MATVARKKPRPKSEANPWPTRLTALREHYGTDGKALPQDEAAARITCSVRTWQGWEQGRRKPNPMIIRLLQLAFPEFFRTIS